MWHFTGLAMRVVRIRLWRDNLGRRRQDDVPAVLSGAAVDLGCGTSVMRPPCKPKRARERKAREVRNGMRAQPVDTNCETAGRGARVKSRTEQ